MKYVTTNLAHFAIRFLDSIDVHDDNRFPFEHGVSERH